MICIVMWTLLKMVNNLRCWRFCIYALCIIVNKTSAMPFVACKFLNRQPMMSFLHISTFVLCAHTVCIAQTVQVAQMHSEQWTLCDHKWLHWFKQTRARENSQIGISFELLDRFYRLISLYTPFSSSVLNQRYQYLERSVLTPNEGQPSWRNDIRPCFACCGHWEVFWEENSGN